MEEQFIEGAILTRREGVLSVEELVERMRFVQQLKDKMQEGVHYGMVPGWQKPALWKPGAEVLCAGFQLRPHYPEESVRIADLPDGHFRVMLKCELRHIVTQAVEGEAFGLCSSLEKKYRYVSGGKENPNIADKWNTILQMAQKDAFVAATRVATACSEFFTQEESGQDREERPLVVVPQAAQAVSAPPAMDTQEPPALGLLQGTVQSITTAPKGFMRVFLALEDGAERACFFPQATPPDGMPAQDVGGGWKSIEGKRCSAHVEKVPSASGSVTLLLKKIEIVAPPVPLTKEESARRFEEMKSKYGNGNGKPRSDPQANLLRLEADKAELSTEDFGEFLKGVHGGVTLDTLPAAKVSEVLEQLRGGFAAQWCADNLPPY